jgi:predicted metal-dependent phosphoesterase TrpH
MILKYCDLHTHSHFSDGTYSPTELIKEAEARGLSAVVLCDHNTIGGLDELFLAARGMAVEAIGGVEFSTDYGEVELHIVGMFITAEHFEAVDAMAAELRRRKDESNVALVNNLRAGGYEVDYGEIKAQNPGIVNRAHIAANLAQKGYVGSIKEAFDSLLSKDGGYYVQVRRLDVFETIKFIKSIGAVAVLAHPFLNLNEAQLREFLPRAIECGLDGMETLYSDYDENTTATAVRIAREFGIKESGGSDFHGGRKPDISLGVGRGNLSVPVSVLEELRSAAKAKL